MCVIVPGKRTCLTGFEGEVKALAKLIVASITALGIELGLIGGLLHYYVYNATHGFGTVEGGGGTVEYLYAFYKAGVYLSEVHVSADVSCKFAAVDENQHMAVGETVHSQIRAHCVRGERERGDHHCQRLL